MKLALNSLANYILYATFIAIIRCEENETNSENVDYLKSKNRIWDGIRASNRSMFAYQVLLNFECHPNEQNKEICGGYCGGSLISPSYILTAAHCCINQYIVEAKFGLLWKNEKGKHVITVTANYNDMILHEGFSDTSAENDICIIKLDSPIELTPNISVIDLPSESKLNFDQYANKKVIVAGWGDGKLSDPMNDYLMYTENTVISLAKCRETYDVTNYQICTMEEFSGSCKGDSGGPLVIYDKDKPIVIGLVSYGNVPCENKSPAVYTFVSAYLDWIGKHIGKPSNKNIKLE